MEEIVPVVLGKGEFEYKDMSKLKFWFKDHDKRYFNQIILQVIF